MDGWRDVAAWDDLAAGTPLEIVVDDDPVMLVRVGDRVFAIDALCTHEDRDLASGRLAEDGTWECAHHGGRFDPATGRATRMPAVAPLRTWAVRVADGRVCLREG
jgi:3-phenylpropionate/trans-cinnamate dioxygenase ferredoxin subunit